MEGFKIKRDKDEYSEVEIELAHKEVIDKNKRFLSRETYRKAIEEERIKEIITTGNFYIQWGTNDKPYIDMNDQIGKILGINTEKNIAILRVPNHIKEILDKDNYVLIFNYMGSLKSRGAYNEIINPKIMSAGLLQKSRSAYEIEVV